MLISSSYARDVEFINYLRQFETHVSKMPRKMVSPVEFSVDQRLNHIFTNYININSITEKDVIEFMKLVKTSNISSRLKNVIISRLLYDLDKANTYESERLRVSIIEDHILKLMR